MSLGVRACDPWPSGIILLNLKFQEQLASESLEIMEAYANWATEALPALNMLGISQRSPPKRPCPLFPRKKHPNTLPLSKSAGLGVVLLADSAYGWSQDRGLSWFRC